MPDPVPNDRSAATTQPPKRVLVVDDEKNIRLTLRQVLEEEGLQVDTAARGDEALAKLRAASGPDFDLVLLDLRMPGTDGLDMLPQVRELHPDLPVVVFTAHGSAENATEAMKRGATDFAEKPFSPQQIRALVAGIGAAPEADLQQQQHFADERAATGGTPPPHAHRTLVVLEEESTAETLLSLASASAHSYEGGEVVAARLGAGDEEETGAPAAKAEERGAPVRTRSVEQGDLRAALSTLAGEEAPDHLLFEWNGPPAEARARHALAQEWADEFGCEVTLVRPGPTPPTQRIAALVRRAPHALVAVRRAMEWARSAGVASLTLLSAQSVPPEGDEDRLRRDGRALIRQVARKAGLTEDQYHVQVTVATDDRALARAAEDFDTLCLSAAHAEELVPTLFGKGEGSGRVAGTVALACGPEHQEPTILESLARRLAGA